MLGAPLGGAQPRWLLLPPPPSSGGQHAARPGHVLLLLEGPDTCTPLSSAASGSRRACRLPRAPTWRMAFASGRCCAAGGALGPSGGGGEVGGPDTGLLLLRSKS